MPFPMDGYIQSVVVEETVYVGGGHTEKDDNRYIVMAYWPRLHKWECLPPYSAKNFAMTSINNKLVLVGGSYDYGPRCKGYWKKLGVWQANSQQWDYPYPPMPTPRDHPSVTSYKHRLVVAGGFRHHSISTVEVLDTRNNQWSVRTSAPSPWGSMKSTVLGETWHLLGGKQDWSDINDVYSVSLEALVSCSKSQDIVVSTVPDPVLSALKDLCTQLVVGTRPHCPPSSVMYPRPTCGCM